MNNYKGFGVIAAIGVTLCSTHKYTRQTYIIGHYGNTLLC